MYITDERPLLAAWPITGVLLFFGQYEPIFALALTGNRFYYLSCSRLYNDYDGIQHDYTKKQGLVWQQVFLPEYAPQEWKDREQLWNAVEEVETVKDSRLAREFVVALPIELSREEQVELLRVAARIYPGAVRIRRDVRRCCHP